MATNDDEKESDKQERKPASKHVRETKVERTRPGDVKWYRNQNSASGYIKVGDKINELKISQDRNPLSKLDKSDFYNHVDTNKRINTYEKSHKYDNVGLLSDRVTILASFISESYSLDWKESEKLARIANTAIERAIAEHRAGRPLSLEPTFTPAAGGADAQASTLTLPDAPPRYPYAPRMEGGIVKYLEDNWAPYIKAGLLSRPDLNRIDPKAYQALRNWLALPENQLPEHLQVPTKKEALDREIAGLGGEDRLRRLAAALASRERRRQPS